MKNINTYYLILFLLFLIIFISTIQFYLKTNNINTKESFIFGIGKHSHHHKSPPLPPPLPPPPPPKPNCCVNCNYKSSSSCVYIPVPSLRDNLICTRRNNKEINICKDNWDASLRTDTLIYVNNQIMKNNDSITKYTYTINENLNNDFNNIITRVINIKNILNNKNNKNFNNNINNFIYKKNIADSVLFLNTLIEILTNFKLLWDTYLVNIVPKDYINITQQDINDLNSKKNIIESKIGNIKNSKHSNGLYFKDSDSLIVTKNKIYQQINDDIIMKQTNTNMNNDTFIGYRYNKKKTKNIKHFISSSKKSLAENATMANNYIIDSNDDSNDTNTNIKQFKENIDKYAGDLYLEQNQIKDTKVKNEDIPYNVRKNAYDNNYIYTLNKCNTKYKEIDYNNSHIKKIDKANSITQNIDAAFINKNPSSIENSVKLTEALYWKTTTDSWQPMETPAFASNCNEIVDGKVIKDEILETSIRNPVKDVENLELLRKKIYYGRENIYKNMIGKDVNYNLGERKVMCPKVENEDISILDWKVSPSNLQYDMCIKKANPDNKKNFWRGEATSKTIIGEMKLEDNNEDYWLENVDNLNKNRKIYKDILNNPNMKGYDNTVNKNLSSMHSDLLQLSGNSIQKTLQDRDWYKSTDNWKKKDIMRIKNIKKYFLDTYIPFLGMISSKLNLIPINIEMEKIIDNSNTPTETNITISSDTGNEAEKVPNTNIISGNFENSVFKNEMNNDINEMDDAGNQIYSNIKVNSNNGEGVIRLYSNEVEYNDYLINSNAKKMEFYVGQNTGTNSVIVKNSTIDTILSQPQYEILCSLTIQNNNKSWRNIFHYGNNDSERMPALWIFPNNPWKMHFRIRTNKNKNDGLNFDIPAEFREFNKELRIKIIMSGQKRINNGSNIKDISIGASIKIIVFVNDKLSGTITLNNSYIDLLLNRNLYIKDPWYNKNDYIVNSLIISATSTLSNLPILDDKLQTNVLAMYYNNLYWDLNELTTNGQDLYIICSNTQDNNDLYSDNNGFLCLYKDAQINKCFYTKKIENKDLQIKWSIYNLGESNKYLLYHKESQNYLAFGRNYDIISNLKLPTFNIMNVKNIFYNDKDTIEIRTPSLYFITQSDLQNLFNTNKEIYIIILQELQWSIEKNNNSNKYEIKTANPMFEGMNLWFSSNTSQFKKLNKSKTSYIYGKPIGTITCIDLKDPNNNYFCDTVNNISCFNKYFYIVPVEPQNVSNEFNLRNNILNKTTNINYWYQNLFSKCQNKTPLNTSKNEWYRKIDNNFQIPYADMETSDEMENNLTNEKQSNPYKNLHSSIIENTDDIFTTSKGNSGYNCSSSSYCYVEKEKKNENNLQPINISYLNKDNRNITVQFKQPIDNYNYSCVKKKYGIYKIYNNQINVNFEDAININVLTKEDDVYYNSKNKKIAFNISSLYNMYKEGQDYGIAINGSYIWFNSNINISLLSFYEIESQKLNNLFIHLENMNINDDISKKRKKRQLLYWYDKLKYKNAGFNIIDIDKVYSYQNYNSDLKIQPFIPFNVSI